MILQSSNNQPAAREFAVAEGTHLQMSKDNATLVQEAQYPLKQVAAQLQNALLLTLAQLHCFLQTKSVFSSLPVMTSARPCM